MRIGPLDLTLRRAPAALAPKYAAPSEGVSETKPKGASGTINLSGFLQTDEYVTELRGLQAWRVYDRMRNDGAVEEALGHMREPVIAALTDLQIEPASETLDDQYAAELCRCAMFDWLDQDWQEFCRQALEILEFGHSVFEVTEQLVTAPLVIQVEQPDGSTVDEVHANQLWRVPCRFAPRLQRTIWRWVSFEGELQSVWQQVFRDDGTFMNVEIPAGDLMVFTLRRSGDNYTGRSLLRAAYKPWYLKDVVEKTMVVAVERHGVGTLVAYLAAEDADDTKLADRVELMLANMRSGEYGYAVLPRPKAGAGTSGGMTLEILTPPGGLPTNLVDVAEYFRGDIKAALLTRFSELGHASVGARSVGEVQTEVWHRSLESVGALICGVLRDRFEKIVADNLPGARVPNLKPGQLESKSLLEFAQSVGTLVSSGAVEPDKSARAYFRREFGMPDEDEGTDQQLQVEKDMGRNLPSPSANPKDPNPAGGAPAPGA